MKTKGTIHANVIQLSQISGMEVKNHPFLIAVKQVIQENRKVDKKRKKSKKKA